MHQARPDISNITYVPLYILTLFRLDRLVDQTAHWQAAWSWYIHTYVALDRLERNKNKKNKYKNSPRGGGGGGGTVQVQYEV